MQILGQLSDGLDEQQIQIEPEESSFRLTFPIQEGGSCSVVLEEQTLALLRIECPEQDASFYPVGFSVHLSSSPATGGENFPQKNNLLCKKLRHPKVPELFAGIILH